MLRYIMWIGTGGAAMKVAVLVSTWAAAKALDPDNFGRYVALQATALFAAALWDFGISVLMTRELSAGRIGPGTAASQALSSRVRTLPIWLAALFVGYLLFATSVSTLALAVFVGVSLLNSLNSLTLAGLRGAFQFRSVSVAGVEGRSLTALASILVVFFGPGRQDALVLLAVCLLLGELLMLIQSAVMWRSSSHLTPAVQPGHETALTVRAASPFAANGVITTAYNRMDVLIVAALTSGSQLGAYAVASRAQDVLYLVPTSVGSVAMPALARGWNLDSRTRSARVTGKLVVFGFALGLCISTIVFALAPVLIDRVLGSEYHSAVGPVRIICWFLPLAMVQAPLISALAASDRAVATTKIFAVTLIAACSCHVALDWWAGAQGAAVATLMRDAVAAPLAVLISMKHELFQVDLRESRISLAGTPSEAPTGR